MFQLWRGSEDTLQTLLELRPEPFLESGLLCKPNESYGFFPLEKCTYRLLSGSEGAVSLQQPASYLGENPVVRQTMRDKGSPYRLRVAPLMGGGSGWTGAWRPPRWNQALSSALWEVQGRWDKGRAEPSSSQTTVKFHTSAPGPSLPKKLWLCSVSCFSFRPSLDTERCCQGGSSCLQDLLGEQNWAGKDPDTLAQAAKKPPRGP